MSIQCKCGSGIAANFDGKCCYCRTLSQASEHNRAMAQINRMPLAPGDVHDAYRTARWGKEWASQSTN